MNPEIQQQVLKLAEQIRQRLLSAQREESIFRKEQQTAAALELIARQAQLLRTAA